MSLQPPSNRPLNRPLNRPFNRLQPVFNRLATHAPHTPLAVEAALEGRHRPIPLIERSLK